MEPKALVDTVISVITDKKSSNIVSIDLKGVCDFTDYFVLCTGTSNTHIRALADAVEINLKEKGLPPMQVAGYDSASWIVIDYGCLFVHIFNEETRSFYNIERLWTDGVFSRHQETD